MNRQLQSILSRNGQLLTLTKINGETAVVRAFLQPIRKKQEDAPIAVTPLGSVSQQRWLYIGSSENEILSGDRVDCHDLALQVQEVQAVYLGSNILYYRALLHPRKENRQ